MMSWGITMFVPLQGIFLASRCALTGVVVAMWLCHAAMAQCSSQWLTSTTQVPPGVTGRVLAIVTLPNGDVVVGGEFLSAGGVLVNRVARWDGAKWSSLGSGIDDPTGIVSALAVLPNGDIVAAGRFASAGGVQASGIARWNGATWTRLGSGPTNGAFSALTVLGNGDVVAGGAFTSIGGVGANRIARWNGSSWSSLGLGVAGPDANSGGVNTITLMPNGELVVAGQFTTAGGEVANNIASWNGVEWSALGSGLSGNTFGTTWVSKTSLSPNGDLIAAGKFNWSGFVQVGPIARWTGAAWIPLSGVGGQIGIGGGIYGLAVLPSGEVFVTGDVVVAGVVGLGYVARWDGSSWTRLDSGFDDWGFELAVMANGDVIAGGRFVTAGGVVANRVARWSGSGWTSLGAGLSGAVEAIARCSDGSMVAGGSFASAGGLAVNRIARWSGATWLPLGSGFNGTVRCVVSLQNGDVVAGGEFTAAGQLSLMRIARWDGSTWSPLGSGIGDSLSNRMVRALAVLPNGDVVVGGSFTNAGGVGWTYGIARWNGTNWLPLGSGTLGTVYAIAVMPNGDLVAGGDFTGIGGISASRIARWNGSSWSPLGSGLTSDGSMSGTVTVHALTVLPNGDLVAGGRFAIAGGKPVGRVARWDGTSWSPLGLGVGFNSVLALAVTSGGQLVAGGDFAVADGTSVNRVARWNGSVWLPMGSGVNGSDVRAIAALPNEGLVVGGSFAAVGGAVSSGWGHWTNSGVPWLVNQPQGARSQAGQVLTLTATCAAGFDFNGPVTFRWQRNSTDISNGPGGASGGGGTVSGASGSLTAANTSTTLTITGIRPPDAGQYTVLFTNSCGTGISLPAMVTVSSGCPADLNGDTFVNGDDLGLLLTSWGACAGCTADLNVDGFVNGDDLGQLLVAWGACGG